MDGNFVGLVAVMMIFGIALAAMYIYTFFHMRKLCREERLAAITRGGCADPGGTLGGSPFASVGNSARGRGNRIFRDPT